MIFSIKKRKFNTENHNIALRMKCDQSNRSIPNLSMLKDNHNYILNIMYWLCLSFG